MTDVSKRLADAVRVVEQTEPSIITKLRNSIKSNMPEYVKSHSNMDDRRQAEADIAHYRSRYTPGPGEIDRANEALAWMLLPGLNWNERTALMIVSVHWRDDNLPWKKAIMPDLAIRGWPRGTCIRTAKRCYQRGIKKIENYLNS